LTLIDVIKLFLFDISVLKYFWFKIIDVNLLANLSYKIFDEFVYYFFR